MEKLDELIDQARRWRVYHKQRGQLGQIEALAASIRLAALLDAKAAVEATA